MMDLYVRALFGGVLIGLAASLMLLLSGRVTGISGIVNGLLSFKKGDYAWRGIFVLGLIVGGFVLSYGFHGDAFETIDTSIAKTIMAGLLVGFGTIMGNGCTSGHGVCGISRLSIRSILATIAFIGAGVITVLLMRTL